MNDDDLKEILISSGGEEEFEIEHNGKVYKFAKRELSWNRTTELAAAALDIIPGKGIKFDLAKYQIECLVAMLTKAPWPIDQTRITVMQLKSAFGAKLEEHIPNPASFLEGDDDFFGSKSTNS